MQILEWSEKKPPKSGDWDLKPGDLQTMCQIKPKRRIIFVILFTLSDISYSIHFYMLCNIGSSSCWFSFLLKLSSVSLSMSVGHLTFPQTLANTFFTGRRMELDPVYPPPPPKFDYSFNLSIVKTIFLEITQFPLKLSDNFKIFGFVGTFGG